ncbi:O-antigen ligase family protein [Mannheimia varigena]|uniref:O-antigen ligase family protein n=1 Tax=Mannheimia varigena TaxID=85404 RepID=UPI0015B40151|nr:O-antigen ligase [Mannheimia varigena]QLD33734.1 O-antigen ligase family protein [Mannheimia varigena]
MLLNFRKIKNNQIIFVCNVLIALFFVTVLTFKKGYSYVPMMLGIIATLSWLFYRFKRKIHWQMDKEEKYFIFSLIAYFLTFVMSAVFNGDGFREIDNPSRILLLIPLIFFFKLYPIKKAILLHFVPIGALVVGLLAVYQKFFLGFHKPFPEILSIQAGNIAITLAMFSMVIALYWFSQSRNKLGILYITFSIIGLTASILSGARGGWLVFPFCFLLILCLYYKNLNKKILLLTISIFTISILIFIYKPELEFQKRYNVAMTNISGYIQGNKNSSLGSRFDMWENALFAITERPILGHGSSGYEIFKKKQVETNQMAKTTLKFNSLHNQYLEAFVKRGVIGLAGLIAILLVPLIIFARRLKTEDTAVKCLTVLGIVHITSHMFFFLSQSFLAHNSGSIFYFFVLILLYHLIKQKENTHQ